MGEWAWSSSLASAGSLSPSFGCNSFRSLFPPKVKEIPSKKSKIRKRRKEGKRGVVSSLEDLNWFDFRNLENLIFFFLAYFPSLTPEIFRKTVLLLSCFRGFGRDQSSR